MGIFKKVFGKATKTDSAAETATQIQLGIEQSRISHNLAIKVDKALSDKFEIADLKVSCSVSEEVVMGLDGLVKDEQTRQEVEKYLLSSGADKVFNNLKIKN